MNCNGVVVAGDEFVVGKTAIKHVELALHLHGVAVDRVFELGRRIGVEVAEAAAKEGR